MIAAPMTAAPTPLSEAPRRQRSQGRVRLCVAAAGGRSHLAELGESGSLRARLPRVEGRGIEAVLVNTAGGVACGDAYAIAVEARAGAQVTVATPAAEKVYRSDGPDATIDVTLTIEDGAALHWLPQETILFDQARLVRRYEVDLDASGTLLAFEGLMFGRAARGEAMQTGHVVDHWRVRRGGDLVFADALRLSGSVSDLLARPAIGGGCTALATLLYVAPDAEARLEPVRAALAGTTCECGASAWNGLLVVRFLAQDIETLRRDASAFLVAFRGAPLPRVWGL